MGTHRGGKVLAERPEIRLSPQVAQGVLGVDPELRGGDGQDPVLPRQVEQRDRLAAVGEVPRPDLDRARFRGDAVALLP